MEDCCFYYVRSARQALDYEVTEEFVINHIRAECDEGEDIAEALENIELPDTDIKEFTFAQAKALALVMQH
eukprot:CAMPEP_0178938658 /NCGR_PEP_ID=MMETSP0786-20121207/26452_1 /TAXON_ID=186022 /ORGANISM="Thalassionema frauenfeldii, Strain CCMP 1798" /LENGTH=70 /DNA_ID=CAMNT_0020617399 /DNA_START=218 /DNA_END=430 /DNA_ORIENTATION=-